MEMTVEDFREHARESPLEMAFDNVYSAHGSDLPPPEKHYRFHIRRKWEFDRALPDHMIAIELEGGAYGRPLVCHNCGTAVRARTKDGKVGRIIMSTGAHGHGRFISDIEKYNSAAVLGWIVLRFSHDDITGTPFETIETIRKVVLLRKPSVTLIENLTGAELNVLYLMAAGYVSEEIAERIGLGDNTVRNYVRSTSQKLCTRTRAASVARGIVWGLIDPARIPFPESVEIEKLPEE